MVAWKRFPVPEFSYAEYQDMKYQPPSLLDAGKAAAIAGRAARGDASACGAYATAAAAGLAERFGFSGTNLHAVVCVLPAGGVRLVGRSHAWKIQRMVLLGGLEASAGVVADWKTPRPMNTLLGPVEGMALAAGAYVALLGHRYDQGWIANRTIIRDGVAEGSKRKGFRVLGAADDELDNFHDICLTFDWAA